MGTINMDTKAELICASVPIGLWHLKEGLMQRLEGRRVPYKNVLYEYGESFKLITLGSLKITTIIYPNMGNKIEILSCLLKKAPEILITLSGGALA